MEFEFYKQIKDIESLFENSLLKELNLVKINGPLITNANFRLNDYLDGTTQPLEFTSDDGTRYEVEVQLGATDPSHIIRTIEYWDTERKRYPQYDHCAVIVAEEITGRFMNVISLFNGAIPLIALQLTAYKQGDDISLAFTKVLDRVTIVNDEDEQYEATDRKYWEGRSTPKMLQNVDKIFDSVKEYASGYELKYNKFYIGMMKDGISKNFLMFRPKKNYLYIVYKGNENIEMIQKCEEDGLDISYTPRWKEYSIQLSGFEEYLKHEGSEYRLNISFVSFDRFDIAVYSEKWEKYYFMVQKYGGIYYGLYNKDKSDPYKIKEGSFNGWSIEPWWPAYKHLHSDDLCESDFWKLVQNGEFVKNLEEMFEEVLENIEMQ
jgi:hypothetical protein